MLRALLRAVARLLRQGDRRAVVRRHRLLRDGGQGLVLLLTNTDLGEADHGAAAHEGVAEARPALATLGAHAMLARDRARQGLAPVVADLLALVVAPARVYGRADAGDAPMLRALLRAVARLLRQGGRRAVVRRHRLLRDGGQGLVLLLTNTDLGEADHG